MASRTKHSNRAEMWLSTMHTPKYFLMIAYLLAGIAGICQPYDIVIKGGHVIDPKNGINAVRDVAMRDGKIVAVIANIQSTGATQVIDATGLYVTPGLI